MRITVADAEDLPDNAYVSIRVGETRRQRRFVPGDHFDFPAAQRHFSLDVFQKIGSKYVSLAELQSMANGSVEENAGGLGEAAAAAAAAAAAGGGAQCVEVMRSDGVPMRVHVKVVTSEVTTVPSRTSRHLAALQANSYLDRHALQKVLQSMVQTLIKTQPEDPVGFMKNYLQDCKSEIQPDNRSALDGISAVPDVASAEGQPPPRSESQTATPPTQDEKAGEKPSACSPPGRPPGPPPPKGRPGRPPGRPPPAGPPGPKPKSKAGGPARPVPKVAGGGSFADALAQQKEKLRSCAPPPKEEEPVDTLAAEAEAAARAVEATTELSKLNELAARTPLGMIAAGDVLLDDETASSGASTPSVLGRGRFASVRRAKVQCVSALGEVSVAAKRFAATSSSALRAARREADALLSIGLHPNVVELLGLVLPSPDEAVSSGGREVSASPLQMLLRPSDGSLYQLLASASEWEALARGGRLDLLVDVGRGLCAMHGASFAHLDVKSHNVLVDRQANCSWTARICDLGSAYHVTPDGPPPPSEGTSGWTAPEILEMHPAVKIWPDPRLADVFSFGVVIWEVVSGPGIDHPLCGLAGDAYCAALAEGKRPAFPSEAENLDESLLASECWKFEAQCRPSLFQATDRLVHRSQVLKREQS